MKKRSGMVTALEAAAVEAAPTVIVVGLGAFAAFLIWQKLKSDVQSDPVTKAAGAVAQAAAAAASGIPAWAWAGGPVTLPIYGAEKAAEWVVGQAASAAGYGTSGGGAPAAPAADPPTQGGGGESDHGGASGSY